MKETSLNKYTKYFNEIPDFINKFLSANNDYDVVIGGFSYRTLTIFDKSQYTHTDYNFLCEVPNIVANYIKTNEFPNIGLFTVTLTWAQDISRFIATLKSAIIEGLTINGATQFINKVDKLLIKHIQIFGCYCASDMSFLLSQKYQWSLVYHGIVPYSECQAIQYFIGKKQSKVSINDTFELSEAVINDILAKDEASNKELEKYQSLLSARFTKAYFLLQEQGNLIDPSNKVNEKAMTLIYELAIKKGILLLKAHKTYQHGGELEIDELDPLNETEIPLSKIDKKYLPYIFHLFNEGFVSLEFRANANSGYMAVRPSDLALTLLPKQFGKHWTDIYGLIRFFHWDDDFQEQVTKRVKINLKNDKYVELADRFCRYIKDNRIIGMMINFSPIVFD